MKFINKTILIINMAIIKGGYCHIKDIKNYKNNSLNYKSLKNSIEFLEFLKIVKYHKGMIFLIKYYKKPIKNTKKYSITPKYYINNKENKNDYKVRYFKKLLIL